LRGRCHGIERLFGTHDGAIATEAASTESPFIWH
jgi:hypothetical protein